MAFDGIRTDGDPNWHKFEVRRGRAAYALLLLVAVGFGLSVLVFYPGYITVDARYVYADAKAWHFGDWQSPAMGVLWRMIDPIAPGSLSMFLLTVTLYWIGFGTLAFIALRGSTWLGLVTPLVAFTPPAFFFIGLIWRDILFGVAWLAAGVLVFAVAERSRRTRLPLQALALALIAFGVLLRPNAIIAAPLLAIYAIWPTRFALKRTAIAFAPAAVLFFVLVPAAFSLPSDKTRCIRFSCSISAASLISAEKISSRCNGVRSRPRYWRASVTTPCVGIPIGTCSPVLSSCNGSNAPTT
jgi:hypothetical protein